MDKVTECAICTYTENLNKVICLGYQITSLTGSHFSQTKIILGIDDGNTYTMPIMYKTAMIPHKWLTEISSEVQVQIYIGHNYHIIIY